MQRTATQTSMASAPARPPAPRMRRAQSAGRVEAGSLLTEPSAGQDAFYDVYEINTIAKRCQPLRRR